MITNNEVEQEDGLLKLTIKEPTPKKYSKFANKLNHKLRKNALIKELLFHVGVLESTIDELTYKLQEAKRISILPKEEYIALLKKLKAERDIKLIHALHEEKETLIKKK